MFNKYLGFSSGLYPLKYKGLPGLAQGSKGCKLPKYRGQFCQLHLKIKSLNQVLKCTGLGLQKSELVRSNQTPRRCDTLKSTQS